MDSGRELDLLRVPCSSRASDHLACFVIDVADAVDCGSLIEDIGDQPIQLAQRPVAISSSLVSAAVRRSRQARRLLNARSSRRAAPVTRASSNP